MKTVAVIVPSFAIEYSLEFLSGIYDFFNDKDVRVLVAHSRFFNDSIGTFNYQYLTVFNLLKSEQIDLIICASGMYTSSMSKVEFAEVLKKYTNKPIISVALSFDFENCYNIVQKNNCDEIFYEIVNHLKTKHGCKKFAFLSANSLESEDGKQRYAAFVKAVEKCGVEFSKEDEIDGKFVYAIAKAELEKKYKKKEEVKFDALIAANDGMALAAIDYFKTLGIKIPDQVKVIGFDNSSSSRLSNPRLSSVSQNIYGQGFKAGELAIDILEGKKVEKNKIVELDILYRQSCGCVPKITPEPMYIDKFGKGQIEGSLEGLNNSYSDTIQEKYNIISFMDIVKSSNTIRQFYYDLPYIIDNINMENIQIVFFKEPVFLDPEEDFCVPENAELKMFYDSKTKNKKMLDDEIFNPSKILFSEKYLSDTNGVHIIQPIFSGEINYGYCICKINTKKFVDYGVHLKIFINAISQAYEYTHQLLLTEKLKSENLDLNAVSRTDELTKILNRRGFKELGQRAIDLAQEKLQPVVVFFGDMDGLKTINDTYGHEMGDKAIKLQAKVLSKAFRTDDIVGRLSGDEFGIIAVGMGVERIDDVKEKVAALNEQISKENDLPFTLSISLGGVDLQSSSNLKRLLSEADKKLYVEKQIKHAKRR